MAMRAFIEKTSLVAGVIVQVFEGRGGRKTCRKRLENIMSLQIYACLCWNTLIFSFPLKLKIILF
jgi:hypothetical protein